MIGNAAELSKNMQGYCGPGSGRPTRPFACDLHSSLHCCLHVEIPKHGEATNSGARRRELEAADPKSDERDAGDRGQPRAAAAGVDAEGERQAKEHVEPRGDRRRNQDAVAYVFLKTQL